MPVVNLHRISPDRLSGGMDHMYDTMLRYQRQTLVQCYSFLRGFVTKEVAFLHKNSKSLIEADLLFNMPPSEQVRSPVV